jgi:four helix bundle protein
MRSCFRNHPQPLRVENRFGVCALLKSVNFLDLDLTPNLNPSVPPIFDHEKLEVYQEALRFVAWIEPILQSMPGTAPIRLQLDRASISIVLNIAEGNGKFTGADRCRFFDISRGSALECAAGLDILAIKFGTPDQELLKGKESLRKIVSMVVGLIKANSDYRMHERGSED